MIREEAIEIWRTHFTSVLGLMIMRTPSWMTPYKGKRGSIKNVISAYVNLSQEKRYSGHLCGQEGCSTKARWGSNGK